MDSHASHSGTAIDEVAVSADTLDECLSGWGPDLLAYLLDAGAHSRLAEWRLEAALSDHRQRARLNDLHGLLGLFSDPAAARAWIRNITPDLGGRSPAEVIRQGTGDRQRIRDLAEQLSQKT